MKLITLFKDLPIKRKLLIFSAFQILIPILVIGLFSAILSAQIINHQTTYTTTLSFNHMVENIEYKINHIYDASTTFLYNSEIYNILMNKTTESSTSRNINKLMRNTLINDNEIMSISLTIDDFTFSFSRGKNAIYPPNSVGYMDLKRKNSSNGNVAYWHADTVDDEIINLFYVTPINDPYNYSERGMLILQVSPKIFTDYITQYNSNNEKSYAIISNNSEYILKPNNLDLYIFPSYLNLDNEIENQIAKFDNIMYLWCKIPDLNWKIVYFVKASVFYRNFYAILICIACLCIISVLLLILFYNYISKSISTPLYELAHNMKNWSEKSKFQNTFHARHDEIGILYNVFQEMADKITDLININYKSEIALKNSELKHLRSQINPHFLFNTLENINAMAYLYDVPQIGDMTQALSGMLDHSLRNTDKYIPLSEELKTIDSYIMIMQYRYTDKFVIEKDIDPKTLNIPVPNLIIQPIVENSIKYGVISNNKKCTITINSYIKDTDMIISVTDNGLGISKPKLKELQQAILSYNNDTQHSIGIINTNKRLTLLFGKKYHIEIDSRENEFTKVILRFDLTSEIYNNIRKEENGDV